MLPTIASIFKISVDELLSGDTVKKLEKTKKIVE